jgi:hypothetical protein
MVLYRQRRVTSERGQSPSYWPYTHCLPTLLAYAQPQTLLDT